jgi:hypothetical protein
MIHGNGHVTKKNQDDDYRATTEEDNTEINNIYEEEQEDEEDDDEDEDDVKRTYDHILDHLANNLESNNASDPASDLETESDIQSTNAESDLIPDQEENTVARNFETMKNLRQNRLKRQNENIQIAMGNKKKKLRVICSLFVNDDIVQFISKNRFSVFLRKLNKSESAILEIAKRLSQYLYHVTTTNGTILSATESYHNALINAISIPSSIVGYMDYCLEVDGYKPNSLTVRLDDISNFIHYAPFYEMNIPPTFHAAKVIIKDYRRLLKRMQSVEDKKTKSAEAIIANRTFPLGGLTELRNILDSEFEHFNSACEQCRLYHPSPSTYRELVGYVLASLWVYSPQGRGAAVEKISLADTVELLRNLCFGSTHSKTIDTYKIQPLILQDERAAHIVKQYVVILRPKSSDPQLLLNYNGKPLKQGCVTKYVLSYFQKNAGYNLGVNSLRRVQCSEVYVASIDGRVTESARKQYNFVQGHSDRINNAVYVKLAMQANSNIARNTFSKLGFKGNSTSEQSNLMSSLQQEHNEISSQPEHNEISSQPEHNEISSQPEHNEISSQPEHNEISSQPEHNEISSQQENNEINSNQTPSPPPNPAGLLPWPFDYLICYNDWGTAHSCAKKVAARIPWDDQEKRCLTKILSTKGRHFDPSIDKWRQLLQEVIDDPTARPLFHRNHVADSTRLREGLREKRVKRSRAFE